MADIVGNSRAGPSDQETGARGSPEERESNVPFKKKFKHSLDSDEEDDEAKLEKYNFMDAEQFDGEEAGVTRKEGEIMVTAFNMKEELEDGHFDKEGTFIFKKSKDEVKDQWVNDLDSVQIVDRSKIPKYNREEESSDEDDLDEPARRTAALKDILPLMKPKETIKATIMRMGKDIKELRTRNRKEKSKDLADGIKSKTAELEKVTSMADTMLMRGDTDFYDQTYEKIAYTVRQAELAAQFAGESSKSVSQEQASTSSDRSQDADGDQDDANGEPQEPIVASEPADGDVDIFAE